MDSINIIVMLLVLLLLLPTSFLLLPLLLLLLLLLLCMQLQHSFLQYIFINLYEYVNINEHISHYFKELYQYPPTPSPTISLTSILKKSVAKHDVPCHLKHYIASCGGPDIQCTKYGLKVAEFIPQSSFQHLLVDI